MRTAFGFSNPGNVRKFSAKAAVETMRKSWWTSSMMGDEDQMLPMIQITDLEEGPGARLTMNLVLKLVGPPTRGDSRIEDKHDRITDLTDEIVIHRQRKHINLGDIMAQKNRAYSLEKKALQLATNYWSEWLDEECFVQAAGRRGTGTNFQIIELGYAGFPNALVEPDSDHLLFPNGHAKATLVSGDTFSTAMMDAASLAFDTMIGGNLDGSKQKPEMVSMDDTRGSSGQYRLWCIHPVQKYDLMQEVGANTVRGYEAAAIAANGLKSPLFRGRNVGCMLYEQNIVHVHTGITYQDDYGAGSNIRGYRALMLGAGAMGIAFGSSDRGKTQARFKLGETTADDGDDTVLKTRVVVGIKPMRYGGKDVARFAVDTAGSSVAQAAARS